MKNKVLFLALAILGASSLKAQLNVGSTSAADASAILQATSTTKGFLPPVMTTTQINAIVSPANGLTVYNSTLSQLQVNVGTPAVPSWSVSAGGANVYWSQAGNTGSVPGTNYVGTTDNASIGFRTNGVERVRIDSSTGNVGIGLTNPSAPLQFANTLTNKKIVLWDNYINAGNDSSFLGFGVNGSTLRYQVPTGAAHSFYNNKTLLLNISSNGSLAVAGQGASYGFYDPYRPSRIGQLYLSGGVINLTHSQYGTVLSADSTGVVTITKRLSINDGNNSVIIGSQSGLVNANGGNTFLGIQTGMVNTSGNYNGFIGYQSGIANTTGQYNTFNGALSGLNNNTGIYNTFTGAQSGNLNTTGNYNVFFGMNSGIQNTTGSYNTAIGISAGPVTGTLTNTTSIGSNTQATQSNTVILGNGANVCIGTTTPTHTLELNGGMGISSTNSLEFGIGITKGNSDAGSIGYQRFTTGALDIVGAGISGNPRVIKLWENVIIPGTLTVSGTNVPSDARLKKDIKNTNYGLEEILKMRPVTYTYKDNSLKGIQMGFLAQDLEKIIPIVVNKPATDKDFYSVNYTELIPVLTKAIQEQQAQIKATVAITKAQAKEIASLKKENISIAAQLADMKDMKIAMAAMQTELSKIAVVNKVATSNIASK